MQDEPLGIKGAGEAGAVLHRQWSSMQFSTPCTTGVTSIDMPATPERIWRAIREAQ